MKKSQAIIGVCALVLFGSVFMTISSAKPAKQKLTMFAYRDQSDKTASKNLDKLLSAFKASNPDIELQIEYGFGAPFQNRLQALSGADLLPDIVFLWPDGRSGKVTESGKIKDLRQYLKGHEAEFAPQAMAGQGPSGEIWELPEQVRISHVMYTNNKLLRDLGLTFPKSLSELKEQGAKIRAKGLIPIAMDNKDGWEMQRCLLGVLVERICGKAWFDRAIKGSSHFSDREFIQSVEVIKDLADAKMFSPQVNQANYGAALNDFVNEKAVYLIDGGWQIANLASRLKSKQKEYVSCEVFPQIPGEKYPGTTSIESGTGYGINKKLSGEKADAAWKWVWFYSGPEGSAIRLKNGEIPAYKVAANDADPMVRKLMALTGGISGGYVIDSVMDANGIASSLNPLIQKMLDGKKTPAEVGKEYEAWVAKNDSGRKKK